MAGFQEKDSTDKDDRPSRSRSKAKGKNWIPMDQRTRENWCDLHNNDSQGRVNCRQLKAIIKEELAQASTTILGSDKDDEEDMPHEILQVNHMWGRSASYESKRDAKSVTREVMAILP